VIDLQKTGDGWYRTKSGKIMFCLVPPQEVYQYALGFDKPNDGFFMLLPDGRRLHDSTGRWTIIEHLPTYTGYDWQLEKWRVPTIEDCSATKVRKLRVRTDDRYEWRVIEGKLLYITNFYFYLGKNQQVEWVRWCEIIDEPEKDTQNDGWSIWHGGNCPIDPLTNVQVMHRGGFIQTDQARQFNWCSTCETSDIVAYRLARKAEK
jgi:hypothetical protein